MSETYRALTGKDAKQVALEFESLRTRLAEAEETLNAIRAGEVDAIMVSGDLGEKVYTLHGADEPYRVFVEQMQEGAVTLDGDSTILYCNHRFAKMVRFPIERVIGTCILDLVDQHHREPMKKLLAACDPEGASGEIVFRNDGHPLVTKVSVANLTAGHQAVAALIVTDLTEQKQQEMRLCEANAELEGFCYSVSHDLRTPLRAIISSSRILMEDFSSDIPREAGERMNRIEVSAQRLAGLIDGLLSFARLGRHHVTYRPIDLSGLAERVVDELITSEESHVKVEIQPDMEAEGDQLLLSIALQNLVSNALKFSREKPDALIRIGAFGCGGDQVYFVADNGIGFEMEYAERIFQPFERLHSSEFYPGSGIGLANTERIITRHNGRLWAESAPGTGATFYFTLGPPDS